MRKRRIIRIGAVTLSIALLLIGAIGAVGTGAWFTDTETSNGNILTAGTLDLTVDGVNDPNVAFMTCANMSPGDTEYQYWVLKNVGSIDGRPSITFSAITNNDNGLTDAEGDVDTTGGDGEGELGANAYVMMRWRQPAGSGTWQSVRLTNNWGNPLLNGVGGVTVGEGLLTAGGALVDNALPILGPGEEVEVEFRVWIMNAIGNVIQSDSAEFSVTFNLDQN